MQAYGRGLPPFSLIKYSFHLNINVFQNFYSNVFVEFWVPFKLIKLPFSYVFFEISSFSFSSLNSKYLKHMAFTFTFQTQIPFYTLWDGWVCQIICTILKLHYIIIYSNNIIEYEEERMVWELELSTWCCFNSFDFDQKFVYLYFVFCEYNENNK